MAVPSSSLKDCSRPHLLMAAARLAVARRQAADAMRSARGMAVGGGGGGSSGASGGAASGAGGGGGGGGGGVLLDTAPVRRGAFVGQLVLRNEAVQVRARRAGAGGAGAAGVGRMDGNAWWDAAVWVQRCGSRSPFPS